ncbi:ABC transporter ATP-binding protein [Orrella daihaiensis]|uniref:ATP-binding cassette domain-containing protein n=1 Tax=Orrella daihaiensis TaxID=2782176 RepID=A0ABY4ANW6_9BURK|nr:ATP-binding cassette domain-containing protein [Orrella daihaiensis]UOD50725.1 ATP-binding cassette domain-containing protein [Orrella daihaiensis]
MTYQLEHVYISRQGQAVLEDICLTLPSGQLIGVIGPNGAGKSTLLAALAGDLEIDQGQLTLNGESLDTLAFDRLARRRAIMAQQTPAVFNLTVGQVLELGLHAFLHWSRPDRTALVAEVAQSTEIAHWLDVSITMLSMGQQQRVHFARTLLQAIAAQKEHGKVWLLLDEPTASQDPWQQQMMMAICQRYAAQFSIGVLLVMHDLTLAAQWCEQMIVLKDKRVVAHGKTSDVLTVPVLKQTFGAALNVQVVWEPLPGVIMSGRVGDQVTDQDRDASTRLPRARH